MCLAFLSFGSDLPPSLRLLLLFNRDEVHERPTLPAHFWEDRPSLLAGRDTAAGGTWLAVGENGRFAFLTNYREIQSHGLPGAPTRGALAADWVEPPPDADDIITSRASDGSMAQHALEAAVAAAASSSGPLEYLAAIAAEAEAFAGFNLVAGDLSKGEVGYLCNRGGPAEARALEPGIHGISNARLCDPWPKVLEGKAALQAMLANGAFAPRSAGSGSSGRGAQGLAGPSGGSSQRQQQQAATIEQQQEQQREQAGGAAAPPAAAAEGDAFTAAASTADAADPGLAALPWESLFGLLRDDRLLETDPEALPDTGYGPDFEAAVSGVFVRPFETTFGTYGTRSQTVLAVAADGAAELRERYLERPGGPWGEVRHAFRMRLGSEQPRDCAAA